MSTEEKLKTISSAGEFEQIAVSVLRNLNPDYRNLLHTGVNQEGQTIKDPVDGILKINKDGIDNYIYFEFTIDKKLEQKWLRDKRNYKRPPKLLIEGDVIKAAEIAKKFKDISPNSVFRLCLCTNQKVNSKLFQKVEKKCRELGIQNDPIIDFSVLKDFLNDRPSGHWIRFKYLGINAQLLSLELLEFICQQNFSAYATEINYSQNSIVQRTNENGLKDVVEKGKEPLIFLKGESGYGKSFLAYKVLNGLSEKYYILRVRKQYLEKSSTIYEALEYQFNEYVPKLFDIQKDVRKILKNKKLLLVIEDVNEGQQSSFIIKKIKAWLTLPPNSSDKTTPQYREDLKIICPIWKKNYNDYVITTPNENHSFYSVFQIEKFNQAESLKSIELILEKINVQLSKVQKSKIVESLNNDPFLFGIYEQLVNKKTENFLSVSIQCLQKFIERDVSYLKETLGIPYFEVTLFLENFGFSMLKKKALQPSYSSLKTYFPEDNDFKIINSINDRGNLFKFDDLGNLIFRHDRIRDTILIRSLLKVLKTPSINKDVLGEPYYSKIIGQTISKTELNKDEITIILNINPLSCFIALQYLNKENKQYFKWYLQEIKKWSSENANDESVNPSLLWEIKKSLYHFDSTEIFNLTEYFSNDYLIHAANFRNGKIAGGISFLARHIHSSFEPATIHHFRDELIEATKLKYYKKIEDELINILSIPDYKEQESFRNAIILLSGYWKSKKLASYVLQCWKNSKNKEENLSYTIWAILQSESETLEEELLYLLDFWANCKGPVVIEANEEPDYLKASLRKEKINYKKETKTNLSRCKWVQLSASTIQKIVEISKIKNHYSDILFGIIVKIDSPITIDLLINKCSENYEKSISIDNSLFPIFYTKRVLEPLDPNSKYGKKLNQKTLDYLGEIWSNRKTKLYKRIVSFDIWCRNASEKDLINLKKISNDEDEKIIKST